MNRGDVWNIVLKWAKNELKSNDDLEDMTNDICVLFNVPSPGLESMRVPVDVRYPSAFLKGYNYAVYGDENDWGFGEHSDEEDFNRIPKNIKDKYRWLADWHFGCCVGTGG